MRRFTSKLQRFMDPLPEWLAMMLEPENSATQIWKQEITSVMHDETHFWLQLLEVCWK